MENPLLSILALASLFLLLAVTGGVGYLTLVGWRDRRLQEEEKRELRLKSTSQKKRK